MSVNSYLTNLADKLIIRDDEKNSIKKSYDALEYRLNNYFKDEVGYVSKFGSYQRNTILPRSYDIHSDVDILVRFNDDSYMPQSYLNRLKNFAECWYSRSEIYQSNPTVVLELNHIKFELVPCIFSGNNSDTYRIPAKATNYEKWLYTSPFEFDKQLTEKNTLHNSNIKRLIRIMKLWNKKGFKEVYSSFDLENSIVNTNFYSCLLNGNAQLKDYFYEFVLGLNYLYFPYQYQRDKVTNLLNKVQEIKTNELYYPVWAENQLKTIFE